MVVFFAVISAIFLSLRSFARALPDLPSFDSWTTCCMFTKPIFASAGNGTGGAGGVGAAVCGFAGAVGAGAAGVVVGGVCGRGGGVWVAGGVVPRDGGVCIDVMVRPAIASGVCAAAGPATSRALKRKPNVIRFIVATLG